MDPRIREHAEIIVEHSVDLQEGDEVVITAPPVAEDLVVALHERIGDRGANPLALFGSDRAQRAFLRASEEFSTPEHALAMVEAVEDHCRRTSVEI